MKRMIVLAALLMVWASVFAAPVKVEVPGQGWAIAFDAPTLSPVAAKPKEEGSYVFKASANNFNLSLFVEKPAGAGRTHKDCADHYWSQASRNRMIAKDSVDISETPEHVRVKFDTAIPVVPGVSLRQRHYHYYFAYEERWVDLHVSVINPTAQDEAMLAEFDRSLRYGPGASFPDIPIANAP